MKENLRRIKVIWNNRQALKNIWILVIIFFKLKRINNRANNKMHWQPIDLIINNRKRIFLGGCIIILWSI